MISHISTTGLYHSCSGPISAPSLTACTMFSNRMPSSMAFDWGFFSRRRVERNSSHSPPFKAYCQEDRRLCVSRNLLLLGPLIGFCLLVVDDAQLFDPLCQGGFQLPLAGQG